MIVSRPKSHLVIPTLGLRTACLGKPARATVLHSLGGGICFSLRTAHCRGDINRARPHLVFVANVVVLRNQGVLLKFFIVAERKIGAVVAAAAFFAGECAARNQ